MIHTKYMNKRMPYKRIIPLAHIFITKEKYDSLIGFAIQPYDIIVSCAGTIGETYVLPQNSQEGIINQALMLIRLYSREIEQFLPSFTLTLSLRKKHIRKVRVLLLKTFLHLMY